MDQPATFTVDFDDNVGGADTDDGKEEDSPVRCFIYIYILRHNRGLTLYK